MKKRFADRVKDLAALIMDADLPARLRQENEMLRASGPPPRWITDLKTMELFERQADGSYKPAYRLVAISDIYGE